MYLKSLEMIGFKSFAEKTRLDFEPGMMAIVGPNGCGKSNIADAIRWVLGEQSAKALRGAKMEDVIFAGTDAQKALGMAEVSLSLADCESTLGTDYHEVTVTRRVHRSGEGQYLINRAPCRLKDIQRLFMDTGIGTQSYSLMEQGRIDRILSSRPEDRRSVFEEASGITKFKADRKEALRKLEQTEANLLRLADIIREVRRQIISLQRQAGKARRFRSLQEELRSHELFFTRERLTTMDAELTDLESRRAALAEREEAATAEVESLDRRLAQERERIAEIARNVDAAREAIREARSEWERTRERVIQHRERMAELEAQTERDTRDIEEANGRLEGQETLCGELARALATAESARDDAAEALAALTARLKASEDQVEAAGAGLHRLRTEGLSLEQRAAARQKEWSDLDARERSSQLRRERLEAERAGLRHALAQKEERDAALAEAVRTQGDVAVRARAEHEAGLSARRQRLASMRETEEALRPLRDQAAAVRARIEWVRRQEAEAEGFPGGARLLLDASAADGMDRGCVLGALAGHLDIEPAYRVAVETVLRPWLDAVVVTDRASARDMLAGVHRAAAGSVRLLAADMEAPGETSGAGFGEPLADHVRTSPTLAGLCARLLHGVRVVEDLDSLPPTIPDGMTLVTRSGLLATADGVFACWMPDSEQATPVARQVLLRTWIEEQGALEEQIRAHEAELAVLQEAENPETTALATAARALEEAQRALALTEGERGVIQRETTEGAKRLETVGFEIESMSAEGAGAETRRRELATEIDAIRQRQDEIRSANAEHTERLRAAEQERGERMRDVTDQRVREAEQRREAQNLSLRLREQESRREELRQTIRERGGRVHQHRAQIEERARAAAADQARIEPLESAIRGREEALRNAEAEHETRRAAGTGIEEALRAQREGLAGYQRAGAQLDIELTQRRTRRQDLVERITQDYRIPEDALLQAPEPAWEGGARPEREALEASIAELRAKLEAMGPVNLVAIEEHEELEKRCTFLDEQQNDLVRSKQQLMDLIRRINQTTTSLFAETFARVNENFGAMFTRLFGGGSAKLLLIDEADVLESGIEIIARPPGKKLQSVSLLSGGERTMAAVALLFALYMVKPSPFCLLDELDAALDDANINRFVEVVNDFLRQSQFIVITHNRQTIAAAHALFGVTMEKQGISRIVSVRFNRESRPADYAGEVPESAAVEAATVS